MVFYVTHWPSGGYSTPLSLFVALENRLARYAAALSSNAKGVALARAIVPATRVRQYDSDVLFGNIRARGSPKKVLTPHSARECSYRFRLLRVQLTRWGVFFCVLVIMLDSFFELFCFCFSTDLPKQVLGRISRPEEKAVAAS